VLLVRAAVGNDGRFFDGFAPAIVPDRRFGMSHSSPGAQSLRVGQTRPSLAALFTNSRFVETVSEAGPRDDRRDETP